MKFLGEGKSYSLKFALHREMAGWRKERSHKVLHASDLTKEEGFCPREFALLDVTDKRPKDRFIGTSQKYTFDTGDLLQNSMNQMWGRKFCVGDWKCMFCGCMHRFTKHPKSCKKCHGRVFQYEEVRFESQECGADCGIDFIADLGAPKLFIIELKTIKPDDFKSLVTCLGEHRERTNLYLRLIEHSDHPHKNRINHKRAAVFYMCKGFGNKDTTLAENGIKDAAFSPFKEWWIDRDDERSQTYVDLAMPLTLFRRGQAGIPQGVCPNSYCKRAKNCPVIKECWSGKYPAGLTIKQEA